MPRGVWLDATEEAEAARLLATPLPILANDHHAGALALAQRAAQAAGVANHISFSDRPAAQLVPSESPNLIITNPPWDVRLEGGEEAWTQLRTFLKEQCADSRAWVLSGSRDLTRHLRMKASTKLRIDNAGASLAFIGYDVLGRRQDATASDSISTDAAAGTAVTLSTATAASAATIAAVARPAQPTAPMERLPEAAEVRAPRPRRTVREPHSVSQAAAADDGASPPRQPASATEVVSPPSRRPASAAAVVEEGDAIHVADATGKDEQELEELFASMYS